MNDFKWMHFQGEIILGCVRWYCKYGISYRDLEEMILERGVEVDLICPWKTVQKTTSRFMQSAECFTKWVSAVKGAPEIDTTTERSSNCDPFEREPSE